MRNSTYVNINIEILYVGVNDKIIKDLSPNWSTFFPLYRAKQLGRQSRIMSRIIHFRISNWFLSVGKGLMQVPMEKFW